MANTRISIAAANAQLDALTALLDSGGYIEIREGAPPATCEAGDTGTLLGTLTLSADAFPAAAANTTSANSITGDASADASGTAGHFRAKTVGAVVVIQGDVTATSGGGDLELDTVTINSGDTIDVTSWALTQPVA